MNNKFISDIKRDFNLFTFSRSEYVKKLQNLAKVLNLGNGFNSDCLPSYFVGNIESRDKNKIIIIGINPGAEAKNLEFEAKIRNENWDSYWDFHKNFFIKYKEGPKIPYYSYIRTCFDSNRIKEEDYFDFCNKNFVNIDLIPYHSSNFKVDWNESVKNLYMEYFQFIIEFLKQRRDLVRYIIVHSKQLVQLLAEKEYYDESDKLPLDINPKRKVYYKKIDGFKFLFFSRFIPYGGFSKADIQKVLKSSKFGG